MSDPSERDLPLLQRRDPTVDAAAVTTRIPAANGIAALFIRNR